MLPPGARHVSEWAFRSSPLPGAKYPPPSSLPNGEPNHCRAETGNYGSAIFMQLLAKQYLAM